MAGTTYSAHFSLPNTTLEIAAVDVEQIVKAIALLERSTAKDKSLFIAYKLPTRLQPHKTASIAPVCFSELESP
jgi:hypothetical protein